MTNLEKETLGNLSVFAASLAEAKTEVDGTPYTVLPPEWRVEDLSRFLEYPVRQKGTVTFQETKSFVAYVNAHKSNATAIYVDRNKKIVTAVLNDHEAIETILIHHLITPKAPEVAEAGIVHNSPGHRDFLAGLPIITSRQWRAWIAAAGATALSHQDLAQFIEDRLDDFSKPPGAEMMELMLNLEAKTAVSFHSGMRLDTGSFSFAYSEDTKSTAGTIEIPSGFNIAIPVLADDEGPTEINVRLRYRLRDKALAFTLIIRHHEEILEKAIDAWVSMIEKETGVPMYVGSIE